MTEKQVINAVGMGFVMLEVSYGLGRHVQYLPPDHFEGFLKYNYLDWIQVFITLAISKISICLFLLRISKFARYRNFLFTLIALIILTHTPLTLLYLLQCIPLNKNWDPKVPGYCFPKPAVEKIIIAQGVFSILTDFTGAAFPVILLWNAKLSLRTKIALNMLMGLGVITGTVCIVRTSYSWEILSNDVTWVGIGNALTRMYLPPSLPLPIPQLTSPPSLEVNFGIIGACAPILRPLYLHLLSRLPNHHAHLPSTNPAPASRLQWYQPPSPTPWYARIFHAPSPTDKLDGSPEAPNVSNHPTPVPPTTKPRQSWPKRQVEKLDKRRHEKPENVTWAKNDAEADFSDSFELPLQGARKSENNDGNDEDLDPDAFGTYRYHRGWV